MSGCGCPEGAQRGAAPDPRAQARLLARALQESQEYRALQRAREEVEAHEAARIMVRDFKERQKKLQEKVMGGGKVTPEEEKELERLLELLSMNPYARDLLEAEFHFARLMVEIQQVLGEAVGLRLVPPEVELPGDRAG